MIAIGCDHGGFILKNILIDHLREQNVELLDCGSYDGGPIDYPDVAKKVCAAVLDGRAEKAILVCGTGIGMSIAANKHKGIRAAVCSEHFSTRYTRMHNDTNVLCLGARVIGPGLACELCDLFLSTEFEGGRHKIRVDKITEIENN